MIRLTAHAKINWHLEITGKREDGYHLLSTVFQTISLGDVLTFKDNKELILTCSDPSLPVDERNLVMKAAVRLRAYLKEPRGAKIHLKKMVPMGAGLGGGSADAAATLKGLLKLWDKTVPPAPMHALAVGLGADVAFFLKGGHAHATGIGDQLQTLKPYPKTWLVLVWPGFGVSTKEAYAKVNLPFADKAPSTAFNRFESLVFPDHPVLPQLKKTLLDAGAVNALMSGSGSAVYAVARSRPHAKQIHSLIKARFRHSWIVHTMAPIT